LSERYEQTIARLVRIRQAGYQVEVEWECHFDNEIMPHHLNWRRIPWSNTAISTLEMHYTGSNQGNEASLQSKGGRVDSIWWRNEPV